MKKILLLLTLVVVLTGAKAQIKTGGGVNSVEKVGQPIIGLDEKLKSLKSVSELIKSYADDYYYIKILKKTGGSDILEASKAGEALKLQVEGTLLPDSILGIVEKEFLSKNFEKLNYMFSNIRNIGDQSADFNVVTNKRIGYIHPILNVGLYKNDLTFINSGLYYDYSLNKLKLDENARAKEILLKLCVPYTYNLKPILEIDEINKICVIAGYITKDFSDKFDFGTSETIAVIFDKQILKDFFNAELTDIELLTKSTILYTNEDIKGNLKKIEILK